MSRPVRTLLTLVVLLASRPGLGSEAQPLRFPADDGFSLAGTYYDPGRPGAGILLLHQCNADRTMWNGLASRLVEAGYHVLSFDYRGYGESRTDEVDILKGGRAAGEQIAGSAPRDTRAAFRRLMKMDGVDPKKIGIGAASCGGALAIELARTQQAVRAIFFLSTYLDETALNGAVGLADRVPLLAVSAAGDDATTFAMYQLFELSSHGGSRLVVYKGNVHGNPLFRRNPRLEGDVVDWYLDHLQ